MCRIAEVLRGAAQQLERSGCDEAWIEARLLAAAALQRSRVWIYQNLDAMVDPASAERLQALVDRRLAGEPLAYLLGTREFYGRSFLVDPRVLIPRPETETLLEHAIRFARSRARSPLVLQPAGATSSRKGCCSDGLVSESPDDASHSLRVVDVGTGSGILGISLALEIASAQVVLVDRFASALAVAHENCRRHAVDGRVLTVQADLLDGLVGPIDLIVANLPYIPTDEIARLPTEVQREPREALDGGADGLDLYRRLLAQASRVLAPDGALFAEIGDHQGAAALELARMSFPDRESRVEPDLEGRDRVLAITPRGM